MERVHLYLANISIPNLADAQDYLDFRRVAEWAEPYLLMDCRIEPDAGDEFVVAQGETTTQLLKAKSTSGLIASSEEELSEEHHWLKDGADNILWPYDREEIVEDCFFKLEEQVEGWQKGTSLLARKTNMATFVAIGAESAQPTEPAEVSADAMSVVSSSSILNIVTAALKLGVAVSKGNGGAALQAIVGIFGAVIGGIKREEPLTESIRRIVNQELAKFWVDQFGRQLQTHTTFFEGDYFPRIKARPRSELSKAEITTQFEELRKTYLDIDKLRRQSGGTSVDLVGLPTYIAATHLLLMCLDQYAQFDPNTEDKRESHVYTDLVPIIVDDAVKHLGETWKGVAKGRQAKIYRYENNSRHWIRDDSTGRESPVSANRFTVNRLIRQMQSIRSLAADQIYHKLEIGSSIATWEAIRDNKTAKRAPLELAWVRVRDEDLIWKSGDKGSDAAVFRPTPPAKFYFFADYAWQNKPLDENPPAHADAHYLLAVKDESNGMLAKPIGYERLRHKTLSKLLRPIPPNDKYVALGLVGKAGESDPPLDEIRCIRKDLVEEAMSRRVLRLFDGKKRGDSRVLAMVMPAPYPSGCVTGYSKTSFWKALEDGMPCFQLKAFPNVVVELAPRESESVQHLEPGPRRFNRHAVLLETGRSRLTFQGDGNLVLRRGVTVLWSTGRLGGAESIAFQGDGNLVIRDSQDAALWDSGTARNRGKLLALKPDGTLEIRGDNDVIWHQPRPRTPSE